MTIKQSSVALLWMSVCEVPPSCGWLVGCTLLLLCSAIRAFLLFAFAF